MQKGLPLRRGSATSLPRESRMLLDDVIEHRCPDFEVPQHRAGAAKESMERKAKSRKAQHIVANAITLTS